MLALGHCCFCLSLDQQADYPYGARRGDDADQHDLFDKRTRPALTDVPDYEAALTGDIKGLRVGIPKNIASIICLPRLKNCGGRALIG